MWFTSFLVSVILVLFYSLFLSQWTIVLQRRRIKELEADD